MFFKSCAGLLILLGLALPAWAAPDCPLEKAHYVIRDEAGMSAGFQLRSAGDGPLLFFFVRAAGRDTTQWFLPLKTPQLALISDITAPAPADKDALDYSATDDAERTLPGFAFQMGAKAPAHILIPRLQELLQYGFVPDSRESQSLAFLDLVGCDVP